MSIARIPNRFAAVLLLIAMSACGDSTGPGAQGGVVAVARADRVDITNGTGRRVFVFVIGQDAVAYTDWFPCVSPGCPSIAPGETRSEPYSPLLVSESEKYVNVYWWHAKLGANLTLRADEVHGETVAIPGR